MKKKKIAKKSVKKVTKKTPVKKVLAKKEKAPKKAVKAEKFALPEIGQPAPAFKLQDQNGQWVDSEKLKGQKIVLYFYPRAMTPGCTVQACGITDSSQSFKKMNAVVLGVSPDQVKKLKAFQEKYHLNFELLSDENLELAKAYGSYGMKKFMGREFMGILRQTFIIDEKGILRFVMSPVNTKTHDQDVLKLLKEIA